MLGALGVEVYVFFYESSPLPCTPPKIKDGNERFPPKRSDLLYYFHVFLPCFLASPVAAFFPTFLLIETPAKTAHK